MTRLLWTAAVLLVLIWAGARAARGGWITRGVYPHDPAYDDEAPTRGDAQGWAVRSRPVAAAPAGARSPEAGPCLPATEKGRALNHGCAPVPP